MACYRPVPARRADDGPWELNPPMGSADAEIPCGKCLGCRADKSFGWTVRATHEASLHDENRFVTLTYDDEHLPTELEPHVLQKFLKKLRRSKDKHNVHILGKRRTSIRYLACGEYGEQTLRPHYHICLFNCGFADEEQYGGTDLSTSPTLDKLWGLGSAKIAQFSPATAGYVASYLTKTGQKTYADADGVALQPPFLRSSSKPAIGKAWLDKYANDLQHGYVVHEGKKATVPRYYQKKMQGHACWEDTKAKLRKYSEAREPARRQAAEKIHQHNQEQKRRAL
jgi:hypothetical protein